MQKFRVHGTRCGDFAVCWIIAHSAEAALARAREVHSLYNWKEALPEPACASCGEAPVDCTCGGEWVIDDGRMNRRELLL